MGTREQIDSMNHILQAGDGLAVLKRINTKSIKNHINFNDNA